MAGLGQVVFCVVEGEDKGRQEVQVHYLWSASEFVNNPIQMSKLPSPPLLSVGQEQVMVFWPLVMATADQSHVVLVEFPL